MAKKIRKVWSPKFNKYVEPRLKNGMVCSENQGRYIRVFRTR